MESPEREIERPIRFCISNVSKASNSSAWVIGKLHTGYVQTGDKLLLLPNPEIVTLKSKLLIFFFLVQINILNLNLMNLKNPESFSVNVITFQSMLGTLLNFVEGFFQGVSIEHRLRFT